MERTCTRALAHKTVQQSEALSSKARALMQSCRADWRPKSAACFHRTASSAGGRGKGAEEEEKQREKQSKGEDIRQKWLRESFVRWWWCNCREVCGSVCECVIQSILRRAMVPTGALAVAALPCLQRIQEGKRALKPQRPSCLEEHLS